MQLSAARVLLLDALEHVVLQRQYLSREQEVGEQRHADDGQQTEQHGRGSDGELLDPEALVVQRELDDGGQCDDGLSRKYSAHQPHDVSHEASVRVGRRVPEDAGQLREEDDVHEVRAQDEEAVDGLGRDGQRCPNDSDDHDGDAQNPNLFPVRSLWR